MSAGTYDDRIRAVERDETIDAIGDRARDELDDDRELYESEFTLIVVVDEGY